MILIPIGLQDARVSRIPWASIGIDAKETAHRQILTWLVGASGAACLPGEGPVLRGPYARYAGMQEFEAACYPPASA